MEELSEGLLRGIFKLIRFVLIDLMCEFLCFWIGRLFLLTITLGRYPRGSKIVDDELFIMFIGFVVSIACAVLISVYL